ncbi:Pentatricopeptide repeat-containing protein, partial [Thalictrum thalictroides]
MIETCKDSVESQGLVCSVVLKCYSKHGLVFDGLEIFRRIVDLKIYPISIHSCNALLDGLQQKNEIKLAWCFCGSIVRCGVSVDMFTWSLIARLLCKEGKIVNAVKMLNSGFSSAVIYDLVIQSYCQMGNYANAMDYLNEMY